MNNPVPASKYCELIFDGTHDTPKPVTQGKLLITSKHITGGILNTSSAYRISEEDYALINKRSKVSQWDILFSMIGSVGEVYLEKNWEVTYVIKNIGVFSCKDEYRAKWLYYYLRSPLAKNYINRYLNGAVQKFLPLTALRNFPVVPFKDEKTKLVMVLEVLDDKIDCNNRINAELEAMAKLIYDYWFVQFDFPDANGKPYKSSGGKMVYNEVLKREIPEGWEVNIIGNILRSALGGTPSTKEKIYWGGDIPWLNSGEIANFPIIEAAEHITVDAIEKSATTLMPKGTCVLSITRHLRSSILAVDACANQSVVGIYENEKFKATFLYPYLKNEIPRLMSLRTGAQQPHINKQIVEESPIVVPPDELLNIYYEKVESIYEQINNNAFQNKELVKLRDWLLPMLMNGQVTVKDSNASG